MNLNELYTLTDSSSVSIPDSGKYLVYVHPSQIPNWRKLIEDNPAWGITLHETSAIVGEVKQ